MSTMKTIKLISYIFTLIYFTACKKEYTCVCTNPSGKTVAFTKKATKKNATNECIDYYNNNYASIAFNETTCEIE